LATDAFVIGFFANEKLYRVDIAGGLPKIVCIAADGRGGAWNSDNMIVFSPSLRSPLYEVPATGGEPKALTSLNPSRQEISHRWPSFLPDGRHLLFVIRTAPPEHSGIYLGSLSDGRSDLLIPVLSNVVYANGKSGGGYLLYAHDATLVARPFDANRALLEPLRADFSASDTGVLVYRSRRGADRLTWFDRNGTRLQTLGETGVHLDISLSPNETQHAS
jgi:eukaryotic-like serine/threonine-protein kinase